MKIIDTIKRLLGIKPDLRQLCVERYGEEFGELYDMSCRGEPIGTLMETLTVLHMIEKVRKEFNLR